ncbi:dihydrodipicolinate synthase family protein [Actinopolymorpha alba]|uniref:dihydrodipicolinate synthase family protein n=1 Tax=Actinopolymorpha alba TaxID=533267 RepID=UPI000366A501|nr:dihydrodipicolinate synthase family protein [Actinopolymorpha alba]
MPSSGIPTNATPSAVDRLRDHLRGRLVAAALTPFHPDGTIARSAVAGYAAALRQGGSTAIAVGAHTGRGGRLGADDLTWLVREFGTASELPVVAGLALPAGAPPASALPLATRLREAGAQALLVCPVPGASRDTVVTLHRILGEKVGLPLVAFVLYERASGCQYDAATLAEVLSLPWVCGVKLALLDDAMRCQDLLDTARTAAPDALVFTGEDRMYGPSLMWGSQAALLGIAAALPDWSVAVLDAWTSGDAAAFVAASDRLDALARLTFREPMEGYVQRMAWIAAWQGILPAGVALDPYAPALPDSERRTLLAAVDNLACR